MHRNLKMIIIASVLSLCGASFVTFAITEEEVSKQLKCQCGCGFPDLASCSCGEWALPAKAEIRARLARGEDLQTILKYFVDRHGEEVLTSPVQQGFNKAAWIVPSVSILVAAGLLGMALYRWKIKGDGSDANVVTSEGISPKDVSKKDRPYLDQLHKEIYGEEET
ncbi:MAG: cytochrome c-type biogenesis protein CcmH [Bdellovibrionales bacterium]|nr:cytochrome c-type biogenesis protein CcmH [Bdellovibrionales bacterium]